MSLKLIGSDKLYTKIKELREAQNNTDSDMFDYYSELEIEQIQKYIAWLKKREEKNKKPLRTEDWASAKES